MNSSQKDSEAQWPAKRGAGGAVLQGEIVDCGRGFWLGDRMSSGKRIDALRNQNIPHNSRTIDRTVGLNGIVSHKSTDLRRKTYRSAQTVYRLGMRFVKEVQAYAGEVRCDHKKGATYHLHWAVEGPALRMLEWFVPETGVPEVGERALRQVVDDARQLSVTVVILRVPD